MYTLSVNIWFQKLMKQFFFGIDQVVFNMISTIYDLLISIARTSILSQADILDMADRIYKLLAIFMIFKVTLSLITYVVNPDDFSDKNKGISKLVTNIVISLSLLILTPYIFNYAYRLQTIILEDNTLANLIFAPTKKENGEIVENDSNILNTAGDEIAFIAMSPFFTPNTSITQFQHCVDITDQQGNFNEKCSGLNNEDDKYDEIDDVEGTMAELAKDDDGTFKRTDLVNYVAGVNKQNLGLMFRQEIAIATVEANGTQFVMDYKYIFSTVVGVVVILLLLTFCMDVAVRSIKLAFLQLIAPIPILSYVDPKSGKDGMFKKWYEMCFKTYLSLFIRLLALYFAVYIIGRIDRMVDIVDGSYQTNMLVKIFVIIGALMFAKQLPKILEGLGIRLDGDGKFTLNPLRKIENEALGGKLLKKPNDMLGRMGKSIVKSPITGMATLGKKSIAGAYSAANGRGFRRGWSSVDSPLKRNLNKKIDEWAPDFAKDRQESRVARLDAAESLRKDKNVEKYFKDKDGKFYDEKGRKEGNKKFLSDLENTDAKYAELYRDADKKKVAMFEAQARSNRWSSAINNGMISDDQKRMLSKSFGAEEGTVMSDNELLQRLQKASATAEKVYKKADEAKTNYGKTSSSARRAAALEAAYDSYKTMNPTERERLIPDYVEEILPENLDDVPKNVPDKSEETVNTTPNVGSTSTVLDRVETSTGVNKEAATENGAPTEDDSELKDFFDNNTSKDEKQKRIDIEKKIQNIRTRISELKYKKSITPDGNEYEKISKQIKELEKELSYLMSQL